MSRIMKKEDLINVMHGATLMGGGGGGSLSDGMEMLTLYEKSHPGKEVYLTLITPDEMEDGAYAAVTAGMGAPTAIAGKDFTAYAVNAFDALKEYAAKMDPPRKLSYCIPVELGGFNTFCPMLISILNGIPFVDCDGAGRAVPALTTLLLHVNGLDTSPLAMANGSNDRVNIELADPKNAALGEILGRNICVSFDYISGLSGWMVQKKDIMKCLPNDTVSMCADIGAILRTVDPAEDIFAKLNKLAHITAKRFAIGKVTRLESKQAGGFDYGEFDVTGLDGTVWTVAFQNENLVVYQNGKAVVTAPDVIALFDNKQRIALTNADVREGQSVQLGVIKATETWWLSGYERVNSIWKEYFGHVGYEGNVVRFPF